MLRLSFKKSDILAIEVANNSLNVANIDLFEQAINTILLNSEYIKLCCKQDSTDGLTATEEELYRKIVNVESFVSASNGKKGELEKSYKLPVYDGISNIPDSIRKQAFFYCVACTGGNVNITYRTLKSGKRSPVKVQVTGYKAFWSYAVRYHQNDCDNEYLDKAVKLVRETGSQFNTDEPSEDGMIRKYTYSVSKSNVRKALNIAVEILKMQASGNIGLTTVKGEKSASHQMACLLLHFKQDSKQDTTPNEILI